MQGWPSDVRERALEGEREPVGRGDRGARERGWKGVIVSLASHTATTATPQRLGVAFVRS